jgi:hypothetical protein
MATQDNGFDVSADLMAQLLADPALIRYGMRSLRNGTYRQLLGDLKQGEMLFACWKRGDIFRLVAVDNGFFEAPPVSPALLEYYALTDPVVQRLMPILAADAA